MMGGRRVPGEGMGGPTHTATPNPRNPGKNEWGYNNPPLKFYMRAGMRIAPPFFRILNKGGAIP